jgi:hypothetical protein
VAFAAFCAMRLSLEEIKMNSPIRMNYTVRIAVLLALSPGAGAAQTATSKIAVAANAFLSCRGPASA